MKREEKWREREGEREREMHTEVEFVNDMEGLAEVLARDLTGDVRNRVVHVEEAVKKVHVCGEPKRSNGEREGHGKGKKRIWEERERWKRKRTEQWGGGL